MTIRRPLFAILAVVALLLSTSRAQDDTPQPGEDDLSEAISVKLTAESFDEIGHVIELCESALIKGLNESDTDFATKLLASTLTERAGLITETLARASKADPNWIRQLPQARAMALGDLHEALERDPSQVDAYLLVGRLQTMPGGNHEKALEALNKAVELGGDDDTETAKALVLRAPLQKDEEKRAADFDRAVKLAPDLVDVVRARGMSRLEAGDSEGAIEDLDRVLKLAPDDVEAMVGRGIALAALERYDDALAALDDAIEAEPRNPLAYMTRARILIVQNKPEKAVNDLDKLLLLQRNNATALLLRAACYQQLDQTDKALRDVDQVLADRPNFAPALRLRAVLKAGSGNLDEALSDLDHIRQESPDNPDVLLQMAALYAAMHKVPEALDLYNQLAEKLPDSWQVLRGRADTYLMVGKHAEAAADYERAVKLAPDNESILNNLSWLLSTSPKDDIRDSSRAIELATKACELTDYKAAYILSTLAAGYAEAGDFKTAIHWSEKAVELADDSMREPLTKELESYRAGKPWREIQNINEETKEGDAKPSDANKADTEKADTEKPDTEKADTDKGDTDKGDGDSEEKPADDNDSDNVPSNDTASDTSTTDA